MPSTPTTFESDLVEELSFHLPEMRSLVPALRVHAREFDAEGFWTTFVCPGPGEEWSVSLDSEIILSSGVPVDAELWSKGDHPWRLHVWSPAGTWDGDVSGGYRFDGA